MTRARAWPANPSKIIVAPSILAADPLRFGEEVAAVEAAGADWHHVDVMDGHFVPNLSFGLPIVTGLKRRSRLPLDVHIMVDNPDIVALDYVKAGADILVFHIEAAKHAHRLIQAIQAEGVVAGIAINPGTPIGALDGVLDVVDLILVMSVNPGFGGQAFIVQTIDRINKLRVMLHERGRLDKVLIEVDGGINGTNAAEVVAAGARALVAGTFVYGAPDRANAIKGLKNLPTR